MRDLLCHILTFFFIMTLNFKVFSSYQEPIELTLTLSKTDIKVGNDLNASLKFKSHYPHAIILPIEPMYGYIQRKNGIFNLQLQEKIEGKFEDVMPHGKIDSPPFDLMDTLHNNDSRNYTLPIQAYYYFTKGQYRIRVNAFSEFMNPGKGVYSNWVYFNCPKEIHW